MSREHLVHDQLSPELRSQKEQTESALYPSFYILENQKRLTEQLALYFKFIAYLGEGDLLAIFIAQEIQKLIASLEILAEENAKRKVLDLDWIDRLNRQQFTELLEMTKKYVNEKIVELQESIRKFYAEINALLERKNVLVEEIRNDTKKLIEVTVQMYRGCARSEKVTIVNIGGFELPVPHSEIANRSADHLDAINERGDVIPVEQIHEEERRQILNYIHDKVPKENIDAGGEKEIEAAIAKVSNDFANTKKEQKEYKQRQDMIEGIETKEKEKDKIDVKVDAKRKAVHVEEQVLGQFYGARENLSGAEVSREQAKEVIRGVENAEKELTRQRSAEKEIVADKRKKKSEVSKSEAQDSLDIPDDDAGPVGHVSSSSDSSANSTQPTDKKKQDDINVINANHQGLKQSDLIADNKLSKGKSDSVSDQLNDKQDNNKKEFSSSLFIINSIGKKPPIFSAGEIPPKENNSSTSKAVKTAAPQKEKEEPDKELAEQSPGFGSKKHKV